ncbi:hypothetical protein [Rhodococcoides yunnanense]|uniref:Uncharacterized protein n=1 Tax=Rhodococcoides yunnanense TaxID=278209 RepID=A0ABU4BGA2_9NOCA|nr:hypothetical protein [Rhodococcus yunnanensis]MDV6263248.1 hypothetical protein [Rhodococcus yunnanensis]
MTRAAYDTVAESYAELVRDELDGLEARTRPPGCGPSSLPTNQDAL